MVSQFLRRHSPRRPSFRYSMIAGLLIAMVCVVLAACASTTNTGQQSPTTPPTQVQKCGTVMVGPKGGMPTNESTAIQAKNCFVQAFQKCQSASLVYTAGGVDTTMTHTFTITNTGDHCSITDTAVHTIAPNHPNTNKTYSCTSVVQKTDGLHFTSCGTEGEVVVP